MERGDDGAALVAENVGRHYGETVALDDVSLTVGRGEVCCLIGPNGAGKTTFVRALTGTTDYSGDVTVFGSAPRNVDRSRVGLLPQEFSPAARLTARELLTYYAGLYDATRDVDSVLADLGLADSADTRYEDLSGGQKRRACVGTALVNDPELLYLDEPTTGIDPAGRRALWGTLEALAAGGTTLILTTHDMAEAERLADRVGLLANGELVAVDAPRTLVAAHGGESSLRIDLADTERGERVLAAAGYDTTTRSGVLVARDVAPEEIGEVVAELGQKGVTYDGLEWRQPTLEDAYLRLTGTAVGAEGTPIDARERTENGRSERTTRGIEPGSSGEAVVGADVSPRTDADGVSRTGTDETDEAEARTRPNGEGR